MTHSWIDSRRDIFIRDIVSGFFDATRHFERIRETLAQTRELPYAMLDAWVGSESKKGPLWALKDLSHRLFRDRPATAHPFELLFDWTIGSIFHESMKLKEDVYQVSSYQPLLEQQLAIHRNNEELSQLLSQYFPFIEKARAGIGNEIRNMDDLFTCAAHQLRRMLAAYASNMPLLRYLLDERRAVEAVLGAGALDEVLRGMFADTVSKAYVAAAEYCIRGGWYKAAQQYVREILRSDPRHARSREIMKEAACKINADQEKDTTV